MSEPTNPISGSRATSPIETWLNVARMEDPAVFRLDFQEHHIGNPLIRSLHGGVVGTLIEYAAEKYLEQKLLEAGRPARVEITTSSIEYLRVTKDASLFARASISRVARRIGFIDVRCWQDGEELPVSKGSCTLRIFGSESL
jgi:acyl-coenzyme A thioesterase PaaI-like protein